MLGLAATYDRIPLLLLDQYDLGIEYTGRADPSNPLVVRGSLADRQFIAFWLAACRVVGGMNANVWRVSKPIDRLIRSQAAVDGDALSDPHVPFEELASSQHRSDRSCVRLAPALAGLRANEARYYKNKYDHDFTVEPASDAQETVDWVHRILKEERGLAISSRPLEATEFQVAGIRMAYVFYESGLSVNVMYTIDDAKKRAVGLSIARSWPR